MGALEVRWAACACELRTGRGTNGQTLPTPRAVETCSSVGTRSFDLMVVFGVDLWQMSLSPSLATLCRMLVR